MKLDVVWFSSVEHRRNFVNVMERFNAHKNPEYAAACYVVSHPEIFYRINWSRSDGPIGWYWGEWIGKDDDDPNGYWSESEIVSGLSSAYRGLIRSAVELYTGRKHYFNLIDWLVNADDEVYKVFVQSLEIRRNRSVVIFDYE